MKNPLVSIIIPVYNTEKYIKKCLKSLLTQSYKNLEIIIIDDGSTDDSYEICKKIVKKDKLNRIKLLKQENSGCAVARNKGLSICSGKYICFVDSDDYIKKNTIKELVKNMENDNLDLLMFEGKVIYSGLKEKDTIVKKNRYVKKNDYSQINNGLELFKEMRNNNEFSSVIWLMFYKKSFFDKNNIKFSPGVLHDDTLFTFKCLVNSNNVKFINKKYYVRRVREDSLTTRIHNLKDAYSCFIIGNEVKEILKRKKLKNDLCVNRFMQDIYGQALQNIDEISNENLDEYRKKYNLSNEYIEFLKENKIL